MSFKDMIKKSVLEGFDAGGLTTTAIFVTLGIAVAFGLVIYLVYRLTSKSGFYNRGFNKTLALLPLITASIVLAMQSSLVISLGMVGALSIVRFRNAVKDPMDLLFLFWSISVGIIVGAGLFEVALIASLVVAALIFLLDMIPTLRAPCLLVVSGDSELDEKALLDCVHNYSVRAKMRSRNITKHGLELIVEMQAKEEGKLLKEVSALEHIQSVNLLTHDGEIRF